MHRSPYALTPLRLFSFAWLCAASSMAVVGVGGCQDPGSASDDDVGDAGETEDAGGSEDTGETGEDLVPTFWQDVAPIYYDSCVECHREGSIAPFALDSYEDAAAWAEVAALSVETRQMPPWLVTDDGSCGEWANSRALSQAEIDTILAWVDGGRLEGTPRDDLAVPEIPGLEGATLYTTPTFTPEPEGGVFAENDEYRCFSIDPELDADTFLTGYEVTPGNDALVHHLLLMPVDPEGASELDGLSNLEVIEALDAESPDRLGWPCFGAAGDGVNVEGIPVTWAPGQGVVDFPAGSGVRVTPDELFVVQIHYNMADPEVLGQSDSTTVGLRFADSVEREGLFDLPDGLLESLFEGEPDALPPGEEAYEYTWELEVSDYLYWLGKQQFELWGFFPHMHDYGISLRARVLDAEGQELSCVGDVPRWDFGWQLYYFYEQPIILEHGQRLEVTCTFDTRSSDEAILPGWGTHNEMCLAGIYLL
ncbi:hypothetical protein G6O69_10735 [Pseudenhygromyxa sp. WMMC2535]|uniref:monooxygenase n=1 Tax=Pseudenhygromyxa sp. WMMC2535 TaxID=2712867 RepID=UPI0015570F31|nr:hypothetical protein [Pseudenhygromyxa sp. WMMC2535]NVB38308.1 hypothetical protein [Pseudenhygromyxa sp. WMMC2535]